MSASRIVGEDRSLRGGWLSSAAGFAWLASAPCT